MKLTVHVPFGKGKMIERNELMYIYRYVFCTGVLKYKYFITYIIFISFQNKRHSIYLFSEHAF